VVEVEAQTLLEKLVVPVVVLVLHLAHSNQLEVRQLQIKVPMVATVATAQTRLVVVAVVEQVKLVATSRLAWVVMV
jgi:hypothetical protein